MSSAEATMEAPRSMGLKRVVALLLKGVVALVTGIAISVVAGASLPSVFGFRPMVVTSGSMRPGIDVGDVLLLRGIPASQIAVGDVVTFRQQDGTGMTTHRVIALKEMPDGTTWLQTKGDANEDPDVDLTPADSVFGAVRMRVPAVGPLLIGASGPTGKLVLLGVPALLLMLSAFGGFRSALRDRRAATDEPGAAPEPDPTPEPVARAVTAASSFAFRPERSRRRAPQREPGQSPRATRPGVRPAMTPTTLILPAAGVPKGSQEDSPPAVRPAVAPTTFDPSATILGEASEPLPSSVPP